MEKAIKIGSLTVKQNLIDAVSRHKSNNEAQNVHNIWGCYVHFTDGRTQAVFSVSEDDDPNAEKKARAVEDALYRALGWDVKELEINYKEGV